MVTNQRLVKSFTVTGLTVFRGIDAVELIGWGGGMLSHSDLTALILVPRMSTVYLDGTPFDVSPGEFDAAKLSPNLYGIGEPAEPHRRLVAVRGGFTSLSVMSSIKSGGNRGLRYAVFSLGEYPCSIGNYVSPEAALDALSGHNLP